MLYARIRLYGSDNRPEFECRLNANNKYDVFATIGGDFNKRRLIERNVSSSFILNNLRPACSGCVFC
jgi:hypothetical protein